MQRGQPGLVADWLDTPIDIDALQARQSREQIEIPAFLRKHG